MAAPFCLGSQFPARFVSKDGINLDVRERNRWHLGETILGLIRYFDLLGRGEFRRKTRSDFPRPFLSIGLRTIQGNIDIFPIGAFDSVSKNNPKTAYMVVQ